MEKISKTHTYKSGEARKKTSSHCFAIGISLALFSTVSIAQECKTIRAKSGVGSVVCTFEVLQTKEAKSQLEAQMQREAIETTARVAIESDVKHGHRSKQQVQERAITHGDSKRHQGHVSTPAMKQNIVRNKPVPQVKPSELDSVRKTRAVVEVPKHREVQPSLRAVETSRTMIADKPIESVSLAPASSNVLPKENAEAVALKLLKVDIKDIRSDYSGTNLSTVGVKSITNTDNRILIELVNPKLVPVVVDIATKKPVATNLVGPYIVVEKLLNAFVLGIDGKSTLIRMTSKTKMAVGSSVPVMRTVSMTVPDHESSPSKASPELLSFPIVFPRGSNMIRIERNDALAFRVAVKKANNIEISANGDEGFTESMQRSQIRYRTEAIRKFLIDLCSIEASRIKVASSSTQSGNQGLVVISN
jgi:hypothetical protein